MTDSAERRSSMPSEDEVRRLVRSVVDAVGAAAPAAGSATADATGSGATATAVPGAAAEPSAVSIAIGADHGGFAMKQVLAAWLTATGYIVRDCGTHSTDAVDYPDIAHAVARLVADGTCTYGIVIDGAGIGSCMAANKVPGVRAALCHDISTARNSREHNYANVLTLGARMIGEGLAMDIVTTWLATPWGAARHGVRVEKITGIERAYASPATEGRAG
jgi:ribose 5-phosphate isomerase B